MNILVIGGGISGFITAIMCAKNKNNKITIYEKNNEVLKKLLLTGNGRCNYWNEYQDISKYHSSNQCELEKIITKENLDCVYKFWSDLGIIPIVKNGYYYPFSESAKSVKSLLLNSAQINGVIVKTNINITDISLINNGFKVTYSNNTNYFDKIIIATGSCAYPKTGSTGWGYKFARKYGHYIIPVNPSLVQLVTNAGIEKIWHGVRTHVIVKHLQNEKVLKSEYGEIQLTNYGVSGICVFNLSRDIRIGLENHQKEQILINFVPWFKGGKEELKQLLDKRNSDSLNITELCDGFLHYKIVAAILTKIKVNSKARWNELSNKEKNLFCDILLAFKMDIVATKDFDNAQVCSGGISLSDINSLTMESKIVKNLYFVGEILDVDGDCGGYNLSFACISALLAAKSLGD